MWRALGVNLTQNRRERNTLSKMETTYIVLTQGNQTQPLKNRLKIT